MYSSRVNSVLISVNRYLHVYLHKLMIYDIRTYVHMFAIVLSYNAVVCSFQLQLYAESRGSCSERVNRERSMNESIIIR